MWLWLRALLELGTDGIGYLLKDRVSDLAAFADVVRRVGSGGPEGYGTSRAKAK